MTMCTDKIPKDASGNVVESYSKHFSQIFSQNLSGNSADTAAKIAFTQTGVILPPDASLPNTKRHLRAAVDCGLIGDL